MLSLPLLFRVFYSVFGVKRRVLRCAAVFRHALTPGSWFQSLTVLTAKEYRSPVEDEDAPIALNLNL